jgi:LytS/YehU family sensor histidine kinase
MLRSQMNPHFIFNSMNSIQSYISGNDNNTAMSYLSKFARLMRGILENSRQSMIPLEDEVETLDLYVELERLRFKNKFEFQMELESGLDQEGMYVPPMLIQPFVENAIKHGLVNKGGDGLLKLSFTKEDKVIRCIVEDNGIGREKSSAAKMQNGKTHRSLGMQVTRERMDAIKKEMNIDCNFKITDLKDEDGKACGTIVEILIPFEEE